MREVIGLDSIEVVACRLKQARLATGLSIRAVAGLIAEKWPHASISHTSLSKYESAKTTPTIKSLDVLAEVYSRPIEWFLDRGQPLSGVRYRSGSRVLVKEKHQYESVAQQWLEAYAKLEAYLGKHLTQKIPIREDFAQLPPSELAAVVRSALSLGAREPVYSIVSVLEDFGVRTIELPTEAKIDGIAALLGREHVVVVNPSTSNDRGRMNCAHELGHILYGDCKNSAKTTAKQESRVFEFASELFIPEAELREAFVGRSAVKLVEAKERFGISMAAMIYRAEKLAIIDARTAKRLWIQFAKRGWRANEPGRVRADKAIRFERLLDQAISERRVTKSSACELMNVSREEIQERLDRAIGLNAEHSLGNSGQDEEGGEFALRIVK